MHLQQHTLHAVSQKAWLGSGNSHLRRVPSEMDFSTHYAVQCLSDLAEHWNHLGSSKILLGVPPPSSQSDAIGLRCSLGIGSVKPCNMQARFRKTVFRSSGYIQARTATKDQF